MYMMRLSCVGMSALLLVGCAGIPASRIAHLQANAYATHCGPPATVRPPKAASRFPDPPSHEKQLTDSGLESFSLHAREMAVVIGVQDRLKELQALSRTVPQEPGAPEIDRNALRRLQIRQQLSDRIALAAFEVSSIVAEAGCEETRTDHLADALTEIRSQREEIGLLVAIVGDALIGVVAGALGLAAKNTASEIVAIFGGALAAVFGTAAIFMGGEYDFHHSRNLLRDLREGPEQSDVFPPTVWRYLNWPFKEGGETIRQHLLSHWRAEGRFGEAGSKTERHRLALFFENGGTYSIEELRDRAEMLDNLKAEMSLMNQDFNLLLQEILLPTDDYSMSGPLP